MKPKANLFLPSALLATAIASLAVVNHVQAVTVYQWNGRQQQVQTGRLTPTGPLPELGRTQGRGTQTYDARLNVWNGAGQTLTYSAAQGTTVYANTTGKGLVISNATGAVAGSMEITGGSFSTLGSTDVDVIGNNATGALTVSGGNFIGTNAGTFLGLNPAGGTSTLTVSGTGTATVAALTMGALNSIVNLNTGGTLAANSISDPGGTSTFNFNGGTLQARTATTSFMTGLDFAYVKSGGAKIKTDVAITIGQALLDGTGGGGLTKSGTGTLTLTSNANTYTGATTISGGTLDLTTGIIYSNANWAVRSITIDGGATVKVSNWGDANAATAGGFGQTDFSSNRIMIDNGTIEYVGGAASGNMDRSFSIGAGGATLVASGSDTWQITQVNRGWGEYNLASNNGILTLSGANNGLLGKVIPGSGGVVKSGNGTWTLSNTNTYTGVTTVNGGILNITGSTHANSAVTVGGASAMGTPKLTGSGTINGAVTVKTAGAGVAGTLSAGDATSASKVGTLSMGSSLTFESGSIFEWDLNSNKDGDAAGIDTGTAGADFDNVSVTGAINVDSGSIFKVVFGTGVSMADPFWSTPNITQTWDIATIFGKGLTGAFSTTVATSTDVSSYGSFTITGTSLTWTAVPEPTSALAGLLITAGLLRRRRK